MRLLSVPTVGEGDCALHAIFGRWDRERGKIFLPNVAKKRQEIPTVVRRAKETRVTNPGLFTAVIDAHASHIKINYFTRDAANY